jgi:hypothetical protein
VTIAEGVLGVVGEVSTPSSASSTEVDGAAHMIPVWVLR